MQNFFFVLASIALTALSWGAYGPLIRWGTKAMGDSHLRPFICVGIAYFVIAVVVPWVLLAMRGEQGKWTVTGTIWSLIAGVLGAVGALGVILALRGQGNPIYVMPLVFGGAPVINTFTSMFMSKSFREAGPIFYAGLILVIAGAATVLVFNPAAKGVEGFELGQVLKVIAFVAVTALSWGAYGPVLHKGQLLMQGSRLRPLLCVGISYFVIAVLGGYGLLTALGDHGDWSFTGVNWSLAGGAAGALGALGIILAFTFGGKPVYVMPLVFGGAPVVNTLISIATASDLKEISTFFYAGLIVVVAGAATVLIFAPKPHPKPAVAK